MELEHRYDSLRKPKSRKKHNKKQQAKIDKHMLREMAERLPEITPAEFEQCNQENVDMFYEYFRNNRQLSPQSQGQYQTCLRQFFWFVHTNLRDKPFYKISKRDFVNYLGYMQDRGLSSSAINLRKSAVSSFCNYIENIVADDMEECRNFRNFTRGMPKVNKTQVYDKIPISKEEYDKIMNYLEERKNYLGLAWVATAFHIGGRRAEIVQFKTEILNYPITEGKNYVVSHVVRGKGAGAEGKPLKYMIPIEVLDYWRLWIEKRGYDHEYVFTTQVGKQKPQQMTKGWANHFCTEVLSPILGRRINPHLFKASCITYMLEQGKDMKLVSKFIAHHNDINTTSSYYDLRSFDDELDDLFDDM